jgi:hypothetical protein
MPQRRPPRPEQREGGIRVEEPIDELIVAALRGEPLSTKDLATRLHAKPSAVYRRCCGLEERGVLTSTIEPGGRLLFCVDDQEVLTAANYERCHEKKHDIRSILVKRRIWSLRQPRAR